MLSSEMTHNMAVLSAPEEPSDSKCVTMPSFPIGQVSSNILDTLWVASGKEVGGEAHLPILGRVMKLVCGGWDSNLLRAGRNSL